LMPISLRPNGVGSCMPPSAVTIMMTYTLLHMQYARPRTRYMDMVLGPTVGGYWLFVGAYVVIHVEPTEGNV